MHTYLQKKHKANKASTSHGQDKLAQPKIEHGMPSHVPAWVTGRKNLAPTELFGPASNMIQTKRTISQPGDPLEKEADQIAEEVMRMPDTTNQEENTTCPGQCGGSCSGCAMRKAFPDEQRKATENGGPPSKATAGETTQASRTSGGQPLDPATRAFMEPRFGLDFSQVRVHTGERAAHSARAIQALAYTAGSNVVFGAGQYAPGTYQGQKLLAHELAHTLQQKRVGSNSLPVLQRQTPTQEGSYSLDPRRKTPSLVRESAGEKEPEVQNAENFCSIRQLCAYYRLQNIIPFERVADAYKRCYPGKSVPIDLCDIGSQFDPLTLSPEDLQALQGPGPKKTPGPKKSEPSKGGLPDIGIEKLTTIKLIGAEGALASSKVLALTIKLPKSVEFKAIPLRGSNTIEISLKGEITKLTGFSGGEVAPGAQAAPGPPVTISLGLSLNHESHFSIEATVKANLATNQLTAGLSVTLTGGDCTFSIPASVLSDLNSAGKKLQDAINGLNSSGGAGDADRILDIVNSVDTIYQAMQKIDKAKTACRTKPKLKFGPQVTVPFGPSTEVDPKNPANKPSYGFGFTYEFE